MYKVRLKRFFLNLQQMTIVMRPSCWHQNFGPNGLSAPAQGLCFNFFSSITTDFNISSAFRWAIQDQRFSGFSFPSVLLLQNYDLFHKWAPSSEFVSLSIPSWQILTAHAQPFRGARDLAFCLKVPLDSLLVWASSGGSGETGRMCRLAWTFAARIGDKYQIRLTLSK